VSESHRDWWVIVPEWPDRAEKREARKGSWQEEFDEKAPRRKMCAEAASLGGRVPGRRGVSRKIYGLLVPLIWLSCGKAWFFRAGECGRGELVTSGSRKVIRMAGRSSSSMGRSRLCRAHASLRGSGGWRASRLRGQSGPEHARSVRWRSRARALAGVVGD